MAIVLTVTVLLLVPALVIGKYVRIALNILRTTTPPLTRNPLDYARLVGEPITFPAVDGQQLRGMLIRGNPEVPRRGLIIFAHEFCSDMYSCGRYCRPLQQVGYDIFSFDFRGHGQSPCEPGYTPRQWITNHDMHDMLGAVAYVRAHLRDQDLPDEIGVFGISRGACAAILAAAADPHVRAVVADGAYSTDNCIEYFLKRWAAIFVSPGMPYEGHPPAFWRFMRRTLMLAARRAFRCLLPSVMQSLARMTPRPMLFIHGEKDSYLPVDQSRKLYAVAGQPKYFWIAPGARHNQAVALHPDVYARLTIAFFDRHLAHLPGASVELEPPYRLGFGPQAEAIPEPTAHAASAASADS